VSRLSRGRRARTEPDGDALESNRRVRRRSGTRPDISACELLRERRRGVTGASSRCDGSVVEVWSTENVDARNGCAGQRSVPMKRIHAETIGLWREGETDERSTGRHQMRRRTVAGQWEDGSRSVGGQWEVSESPLSTRNGGGSAGQSVTRLSLSARYPSSTADEANDPPDTGRLVPNPPTPSFRLETVVGVGGCR